MPSDRTPSQAEIEAAAEAIWTEVDGPLAVGPEVQGHERNLLRAEAALSAAATARPAEMSAQDVVTWLRSEEWKGDTTWEFYAHAIADDLERHLHKRSASLGEGEGGR